MRYSNTISSVAIQEDQTGPRPTRRHPAEAVNCRSTICVYGAALPPADRPPPCRRGGNGRCQHDAAQADHVAQAYLVAQAHLISQAR